MEKLSAVTLKQKLWETLNAVKEGQLEAANGDAIASQAREIIRTVRTQVLIIEKAHEKINKELLDFATI